MFEIVQNGSKLFGKFFKLQLKYMFIQNGLRVFDSMI